MKITLTFEFDTPRCEGEPQPEPPWFMLALLFVANWIIIYSCYLMTKAIYAMIYACRGAVMRWVLGQVTKWVGKQIGKAIAMSLLQYLVARLIF
jgi:hypothetical protein